MWGGFGCYPGLDMVWVENRCAARLMCENGRSIACGTSAFNGHTNCSCTQSDEHKAPKRHSRQLHRRRPVRRPSTCDVSHHAQGGGADDTLALQGLLDDPDCAEILFPSGGTFAASALFVRRSNVVLTIEVNGTLAGRPAAFARSRPDCISESGLEFAWTSWCALLRVEAAANFTLRGGGTLEPGGVGGASPDFYSAVHVTSTVGVVLRDVRVHCTAWWWCTVLHNASFITVSHLFVDGFDGRDGMDFVNCRHVRIEDSQIEGSDDALCFKSISNGGLSAFPSYNVSVRRSTIASRWCSAIQFGSATEVDMHSFAFESILITSARKAAVGIVSMDGANISNVSFTNLTIDGLASVATPFFLKVGHRADCEDGKGTCWFPGSIRGIHFVDVAAVRWGHVSDPAPGHAASYAATIEGLNASYPIGPLSIDGLSLAAPGGGTAADAHVEPPMSPEVYQPRYDGRRPSYGLFVRFANNLSLGRLAMHVQAAEADGRPAIVAGQVIGLQLKNADVGGAGAQEPCQLATRNCSGDWSDGGKLVSCTWAPTSSMAPLTARSVRAESGGHFQDETTSSVRGTASRFAYH